MKYLAIFKDSLLEAIDTKVFYVTIAFSLCLALVVASISYQPVEAKEAFSHIIQYFPVVFPDRGNSLQADRIDARIQMDDLTLLNDAKQPQEGDYRILLHANEKEFRRAVEYWNRSATVAPGAQAAADLPDDLMGEFIKSQFATFGNVDVSRVERVKSAEKDRITFVVETRGTKGVRGWPHVPCLLFGAYCSDTFKQSLGFEVYWIEDRLVNGIGAWVGILVSVIITAFFVPNMIRKGTVDLLLVKPIHRSTLLIYKYLGGLTFIFLNSAVAVVGVWLALGLRSGIWATGFLLTIFVMTFFFAILYAVSTFFGVMTRNVIVSILMTVIVWFVLWVVGTTYEFVDTVKKDKMLSQQITIPSWLDSSVDRIHYALPRTADLNLLTTKLLARDIMTKDEIHNQRLDRLADVQWGESLTVSGIFIAVLLGLSCWRFATRDY